MDKHQILDEFGQRYMSFVRDTVIKDMLEIINGQYGGNRRELEQGISKIPNEFKNILQLFVATSIDKTLHYSLFMLQEYEDDTKLIIEDEEGNKNSLAEVSDGLCGELYTEDGWIERFSKYPSSVPNK